jgi:hypothetical protein
MLAWIPMLGQAGSAPDYDTLDTTAGVFGETLPLVPFLPTTIAPHERNALTDAFRAISTFVNSHTFLVRTVTSDVVATDHVMLVDASAGAVTVSLLPASEWGDNPITVKKLDGGTNSVKVVAQSGETIDGTRTRSIATQYTVLRLASNGFSWHII